MRFLAVAALVAVFPCAAWADEGEPIRAGTIARRHLEDGLGYAVYAPEKWRSRKPVPVVFHAVLPRQIPYARLQNSVLPQEADRAARDGFVALHVAVLLEAPNKENTSSSRSVDRGRYVQLLERDVDHVARVLEAVAQEASVRRDAVFIRGIRFSAEAALGIAMLCPDRFAGAMAMEMQCSTINWVDDAYALPWSILPAGEALERARPLPIFLTHLRGMGDTKEKARKVTLMQALLKEQGFRHVDAVPRDDDSDAGYFMTPEGWAWLQKVAEDAEQRSLCRAERDGFLETATRHLDEDRLASALRSYAKARKLESSHDLAPTSADLYTRLEARGRALLRAADGLDARARKLAFRKAAKLFDGTPLGDEVEERLEAMP